MVACRSILDSSILVYNHHLLRPYLFLSMPFLEQSQGTAISGGNFHDASVNYITNNYTGNSSEYVPVSKSLI